MRTGSVLLVLLLIVGCGSATPSSGSGGNLTDPVETPGDLDRQIAVAETTDRSSSAQAMGQVAVYSDGVLFIRWTETSRNGGVELSGVLHTASLSSNGQSVQTDEAGFEGIRSGSEVSLSFPQGLGLSNTVTGSFDDGALTLFFSTEGGTLQPVEFHRGTVEDYNVAIDGLQGEAASQRAGAEAWAQAERDVRQQLTPLQGGLFDAASALDWVETMTETAQDITLEVLSDSVDWMADEVEYAESDPDYADVIPGDLEVAEENWELVTEDLASIRGSEGVGAVERALEELPASVSGLEGALQSFEETTGADAHSQFPDARSALQEAERLPGEAERRIESVLRTAEEVEAEGEDLIQRARELAEPFS